MTRYDLQQWPEIERAYTEQWPILTNEWKATGSESFGSVRFHRFVEMADPDLEARYFLVQGVAWHQIGIEVRHNVRGVAVCNDIGVKATCSEEELTAAWNAHIGELVADVKKQYQDWLDEIDEEYRIAKENQKP